jgi:hypothetical protein
MDRPSNSFGLPGWLSALCRERLGGGLVAFAMGFVLPIVLVGCDAASKDSPTPAVEVSDPATACRNMRGRYIPDAGAGRTVGEAPAVVTVELPGAHWCEVPDGPYASKFYHFAYIVALRSAGRPPTPSEYAHTFFLVAAALGPSVIPPENLRDLGGLHAALQADLRAGLTTDARPDGAPGLLVWEHGPGFRTVHGEVGAPLPGSNCVPTRIVYEARDNPRFPAGTVLRITSVARYCLAPSDSATPAFALLRGSERRLAHDPEADARSAEWSAILERFFASVRYGPAPPGGPTLLN